jgi:hypothetical protein
MTSYVAWCAGLLDSAKDMKLTHLAGQTGKEDWKAAVRTYLGVDDAFVRDVYAACTAHVPRG